MTPPGETGDAELIGQVLRPYRDHSRYLRQARVSRQPDGVSAQGRFSIAESCYIDDTGHFNAVEFNICYNQLGYYLLAKCIEEDLFDAFATWSMADFWERQLSDVLIYRISSRYRRMINPRSFEGEIVFQKPRVSARPDNASIMSLETTCSFWDSDGGSADGTGKIAFTRLPEPAV
ncbi:MULTISPECIES: FcoT family thioesterase [unclassified Streptomyces]|uniref:FcoT family thioesterase n=1 Tax=unclassified Streptomyces TaxID=2593676 RepID=UPI0004BEB43D|nr:MULTISPECIES: FcoT family thioesterase [unclassified Streptomyces]